jgi:hypothetical protein
MTVQELTNKLAGRFVGDAEVTVGPHGLIITEQPNSINNSLAANLTGRKVTRPQVTLIRLPEYVGG